MSRWKKHGEWGCWVEAKMNAPELVKDRHVPGWVFMSSVSDAYQPTEKDLKLTRKVLENLDRNIKLSILTKSDLILRDIDLLKQFKTLEVGLTINSFAGKEKELFEPNSPTNEARIECLKKLKQAGFKTYAFVSPIIPNLTDVKKVIESTKKYADFYWFEMINLRGAGKEFTEMLETSYPESLAIIKDKKLMSEFEQKIKALVQKQNIKIRGIETHNKQG